MCRGLESRAFSSHEAYLDTTHEIPHFTAYTNEVSFEMGFVSKLTSSRDYRPYSYQARLLMQRFIHRQDISILVHHQQYRYTNQPMNSH
jgi:hypothetical protein